MARFSPQPFGTGQIFPIASSLVAKIRPVFVSPRFSHSEKSAPVAAVLLVLTGPSESLGKLLAPHFSPRMRNAVMILWSAWWEAALREGAVEEPYGVYPGSWFPTLAPPSKHSLPGTPGVASPC